MISLQPREQFAIVWQKDNHNDLATYYVRAVVRNSVSGATIESINLTDNGSGRFSKIWEAPSDVSGVGFYIDITVSVYSDSGYTTKAATYGDENAQYLVFDRITRNSGGGWGSDVDYKKIDKLFAKGVQSIKVVDPVDLGPVLKEIKGVLMAIKGINFPIPEKQEKIDLTPIIKQLSTVEKSIVKSIVNKDVTKPTDLSMIAGGLSSLYKLVFNLSEKIKGLENRKVTEEKGGEVALSPAVVLSRLDKLLGKSEVSARAKSLI